MNDGVRRTLTFGGAAVAAGAATLVVRAICPGGCAACGTCTATVAPTASVMLAVGAASVGSTIARRRAPQSAETRDDTLVTERQRSVSEHPGNGPSQA